MARKIIFLFVLLLASSIQPVFANHSDGVDITYESIDSLVFEVNIKAYRSCKGVPYLGYPIRLFVVTAHYNWTH